MFVLLYVICAVAYAALTLLALAQPLQRRFPGWFLAASGLTSASTALAALTAEGPNGAIAIWCEIGRSCCWYAFVLSLYRGSSATQQQIRRIFQPLGLMALTILCGDILLQWDHGITLLAASGMLDAAARIGFAVCGLLLLENLYRNTPAEARWNINLLCVGLGSLFVYDLIIYADAVLLHRLSTTLVTARPAVMLLAAPVLAIAMARHGRWAADLRLSHDAAFHSVTLIVCGLFLLGVALGGEVLRGYGSAWGRVAETTLISAAIFAISLIITSGSARSRIRRLVVMNFFRNRYDYRKEWMRCIDTLTTPEAFVAWHKRAIQAAADLVDSPAGALFLRPPQAAAFQWAGSWNMPPALSPVTPVHPMLAMFRDNNWIVHVEDQGGAPAWFPDLPRAWIVLPLNHLGSLIGFVVLARSRVHFKLDREAYDLLRVVGREIASRAAEQRAEQVLVQTRQLREYGQRFAFVVHDIKNVSGQLSMLLANAEIHAGNPAFQRDMLATIRASANRITRLLSRLEVDRRERAHAVIPLADRLSALVQACRWSRRQDIEVSDHSHGAGAAIDPDAFDAIVIHLLNNAAEASPAERSVKVSLKTEAGTVVMDIKDQGPGMTPEFIRDELFRPLCSTKRDGHGIGAFQARELLREAGGDLLVTSRPGHGTSMRVILPGIHAELPVPVGA